MTGEPQEAILQLGFFTVGMGDLEEVYRKVLKKRRLMRWYKVCVRDRQEEEWADGSQYKTGE